VLSTAIISPDTDYFVTTTFAGASGVFNAYLGTTNYTKTSVVTTSVANETTAFQIGHAVEFANNPTGTYWDGVIDELRIRNDVLSPSWNTTKYNNQSSPTTFYWVGAEETNGTPPATSSTDNGLIWFD
jgi:hypothetical protein